MASAHGRPCAKRRAARLDDLGDSRDHRRQEPWPDFLTFYGTPASGAGWIVPKRYIEKVGDQEFKNQPIGLGPYRFVSHQPGLELILEANTHY